MSKSPKATNRRARTYARNRIISRRGNENIYESDGQYLIKLVLCVILSTLWVKFGAPIQVGGIFITGVPVGLIIGALLVNRLEKFQFNRKIMYTTLIIFTTLCYFLPAGIVI